MLAVVVAQWLSAGLVIKKSEVKILPATRLLFSLSHLRFLKRVSRGGATQLI